MNIQMSLYALLCINMLSAMNTQEEAQHKGAPLTNDDVKKPLSRSEEPLILTFLRATYMRDLEKEKQAEKKAEKEISYHPQIPITEAGVERFLELLAKYDKKLAKQLNKFKGEICVFPRIEMWDDIPSRAVWYAGNLDTYLKIKASFEEARMLEIFEYGGSFYRNFSFSTGAQAKNLIRLLRRYTTQEGLLNQEPVYGWLANIAERLYKGGEKIEAEQNGDYLKWFFKQPTQDVRTFTQTLENIGFIFEPVERLHAQDYEVCVRFSDSAGKKEYEKLRETLVTVAEQKWSGGAYVKL